LRGGERGEDETNLRITGTEFAMNNMGLCFYLLMQGLEIVRKTDTDIEK